MSITVKEHDIGVFWRKQTTSLLAFARRVGNNANNTCPVINPHRVNRVFKVDLQILSCLAFTRRIMYLYCVSLTDLVSNSCLLNQ